MDFQLFRGGTHDMSKTETRRDGILELVRRERAVGLADIAQNMDVSYMTVRRDLKVMEEKSLLSVINGVAVWNADSPLADNRRYSLADAGTQMVEEKDRIGRLAASLIENNDTIIIDTGSTAEFLARHIPGDKHITIICYTINTLVEVYRHPNCQIVFPGGYFHNNSLMFECPEGIALIKRNRATKAFITASGVCPDLGVTCDNHYESPVKRTIIESSQQRILLFDSSKLNRVRIAHFAELNEFGTIITDSGIPKSFHKLAKDRGIELLIA